MHNIEKVSHKTEINKLKYLYYILTLITGLITSFFTWIYIQRANLNYNSEGKIFSIEDGIVYYQQAKVAYGILALLGVVLTGLFMIKIIVKIKVTVQQKKHSHKEPQSSILKHISFCKTRWLSGWRLRGEKRCFNG